MHNSNHPTSERKESQLGSRLGIVACVLAICGTIWANGADRATLAANISELKSAVVALTSTVAANTAAISKLQLDQGNTSTKLDERTRDRISRLEVVGAQNHKAIRQQTDKAEQNRADLHRQTLRQEQLAVQQERDRESAANAAAISSRTAFAARAVAAKAADDANAAKVSAADSADSAADAVIAAATPAVVVVAPKPAPRRSVKSLILGDPVEKPAEKPVEKPVSK
jgi:hypothetical protein